MKWVLSVLRVLQKEEQDSKEILTKVQTLQPQSSTNFGYKLFFSIIFTRSSILFVILSGVLAHKNIFSFDHS
jgi:hypothetical protein